jgi:hypothetical protein
MYNHMVHLEIVCTQKWNSPGGLYLSVLKIPHAEVAGYGKYMKKEREKDVCCSLCNEDTFQGVYNLEQHEWD